MKFLRSLIILMGVLMATESMDAANAADPENTLVMELKTLRIRGPLILVK